MFYSSYFIKVNCKSDKLCNVTFITEIRQMARDAFTYLTLSCISNHTIFGGQRHASP